MKLGKNLFGGLRKKSFRRPCSRDVTPSTFSHKTVIIKLGYRKIHRMGDTAGKSK